MRPAARVQAVVEILDEVEQGIRSLGAPADAVVAGYCRSRRYIGSKDRRAITSMVYDCIRRRGLHLWRLSVAGVGITGRSLLISELALNNPEAIGLFGEEGPHSPAKLTVAERKAISSLPTTPAETLDGVPISASCEVPACVEAGLRQRFGSDFEMAVAALNTTAPLDIRTNPVRQDKNIIHHIREIDEDIENTEYSPIGFRSYNRPNITGSDIYRHGSIEIQDEAAQVACYLVDAEPGMSVVDLCAGAGGKSLLISALMENKGQLFAFDTSGRRLHAMKPRLERAGCRNIQASKLPSNASDRRNLLSGFREKADRVIVDVPCSGTGTWRRNPDQRWRLSPEQIFGFSETQYGLVREGARMVRAGGRLIYMTCSLLPEENEAVIEHFVDEYSTDWKLKDYRQIWSKVLTGEPPETTSSNRLCMQFVPHLHRTDGFFVAVLEKSPFS